MKADIKSLRLFPDDCPKQNKNNSLIRLCMPLFETGRFEAVQQFFAVRGHSFLPCDSDFGVIKNNMTEYMMFTNIRN